MTSITGSNVTDRDTIPALTVPAEIAEQVASVLAVARDDIHPLNDDVTISYPQLDFPFVFFKFINEVSQTHPQIVAWSTCGNYFQIDRNAMELTTLIGSYFQHSVYQSLRRQMNMYGFHLTDDVPTSNRRHTYWWSRPGGYFCRDKPQLNKVRPRRRPERSTTANDVTLSGRAKTTTTSLLKRRPKVYTSIDPSTGNTNDLPPSTLSSTTELNSSGAADRNDRVDSTKEASERTAIEAVSDVPSSTTTRDTDDRKGWDGIGKGSNDRRVPPQMSQTFPSLLHQFISNCAISSPAIVQWNSTRTAFNVEIHHPELPALLSKYFQHGNYSSLRRQLNFYGFRRDEDGFYRNEKFSEGHFVNIVSRAAKDRKRVVTKKAVGLHHEGKNKITISESDDLSTLFDHDLSTYDTLKNDDMSFDCMDDKDSDSKNLDPLNNEEQNSSQTTKPEPVRKFNVLDKVYVRDKDGVMYIAVIRRYICGPQYHKQVDMGQIDSVEEAQGKNLHLEDHELMWHYFVHFDFWNVNFDRWVTESDVYPISDKVAVAAQMISKAHRALLQEMRKKGTKGKKSFQTVHGATFLKEWKQRLQKILEEFQLDPIKDLSAENSPTVSVPSDQSMKKQRKCFAWTKAALSTERKYREQGLTSKKISNLANGIVIPFALKKVVVQQWEYINQCEMIPCIPASVTIRQALNSYLESKNISCTTPSIGTPVVTERAEPLTGGTSNEFFTNVDCVQRVVESQVRCEISTGSEDNDDSTEKMIERMRTAERNQEWRDMTDGIATLFDESLESRLLYREEQTQLRTICCMSEYSATPYSELYGCEHLLRLFIRLPEMLADNLPDDEGRPIMAKVNDFIRFLHKNHGNLLTQTHRPLSRSEKCEQKLDEKKRKGLLSTNNSDIASLKKARNVDSSD